MATEKLRAELELITSTAEKDLARFHRSLKSVEKTVASVGGKGGKSMRPLGEGLSAATANASEFEKSMAAANARVIAFGASAGLIIQVQRALKETVKATVEVEKALTDINIVLNANSANLQKFGDSLFKVAGQTGQGFQTVAVAATELARQGLSMEKTLLRTKDALILTRLTGMGAEEAVSSLTAAVNSFSKAGITSSQVVNKMAKVDQAFAVSSDDLAKAISRVGSSAVDAGVSMDELLAITTAVQQRTARGGAVIGNAFKTIFTRIGRTDVQKKLAAIGVATRDMQGQMLPATKVLENLADKFQHLGQMQQNQIAESVAGVFQVNILRATLGDLSTKYGVYNRALKESASATNEAYQKNEQLNETLDALVNKSLANLTKAGAAIGGATLKPAIENVLNLVNSAIGAFSEGGRFEEFGKGIGKDLLTGIGSFISGPGLAILTVGIGKLLINFGSFAKTAVAGVLELNKGVMARKGIEESVTAALMKQPSIIKQIERGELNAATAAKDMLAAMRAQNMEASKLAVTSRAIAGNMMGMGMGARGGRGGGRPGRASGFVPNFADADAERASAAAGGYKAGVIKTMNVPGEGSMMYNGAETVKRFPGMTQPAIMPPKESPAGANYMSAFGAAHGFDPYAADGFVPNFARRPVDIFNKAQDNLRRGEVRGIEQSIGTLRRQNRHGWADELEEKQAIVKSRKAGAGEVAAAKAKAGKPELRRFNAAQTLGLLGLSGQDTDSHSSTTGLDQIGKFREGSGLSNDQLKKYRVTFANMQSRSIEGIKRGKGENVTRQKFSDKVSELLTDPVAKLSDMVFDGALGNDNALDLDDLKKKFKGNTQLLPPGAEGSIFEAAVNLGLLTTKTSAKAKKDAFDQSTKGAQKPFDFEEVGPAKPDFKSIFDFHKNLVYADAKRTIDNKSMGTLINKAYNRGVAGLPYMELLKGSNVAAAGTASKKTPKGKRSASGHVPNFSPLGDAITRERAAGVPVSAIRVSSSPVLKGPGNPGGLGVHNTIDEPAGLGQGISRSRRMGIDPKTHGAAQGLIPNFTRRTPIDSAAGYWSPGMSAPLDMSALSWIDEKKKEIKSTSRPTPVEAKPPTKPLGDAPDKIDRGATKFAGAVDKFMTPLLAISYMGGPAIGNKYGAEAENQFQSMLGGAFAGQMGFAGASSAVQGIGKWGAAQKATMGGKLGMMPDLAGKFGYEKFSKKEKFLSKIIGTSKTPPIWAKMGRAVPRIGKALPLATMALASGLGYMGLTDDPEDIEHQLSMKRLSGRQDKLKGLGGSAGVLTSNVSTISQNYDTMTNPQVVKAYEDLNKQSNTLLEDAMLSGEAIDTTNVESAMNEFGNAMLKDAGGIESAQERASKALKELTDRINELGESAESEKKVEELRKLFKDSEDVQESFRLKEKAGGNIQDDETVKGLFLKHMGKYMARSEDDGTITGGNRYGNWLGNRAAGYKEEAYLDDRARGAHGKYPARTLSRARATAGDVAFGQGGAASWFSPSQWGGDFFDSVAMPFRDDKTEMERMVQQEFGNINLDVMTRKFVEDYTTFMGEAVSDNLDEKQKEYIKAIKGAIGFTEARKKFIHEGFDDLVEKSYMGPKGKPVKEVTDFIDERNIQDQESFLKPSAQSGLSKWRWLTGGDSSLESQLLQGMTIATGEATHETAADQPNYMPTTQDEAIRSLKIDAINSRLTEMSNRIETEESPTKQLEALLETGYFPNEKSLQESINRSKLGKDEKGFLGKTEVAEIIKSFFEGLRGDVLFKLNEPEKKPGFTGKRRENLNPFAVRQINLQDQATEGKRELSDLKKQNKHDEALAKVKGDLTLATAKATMNAEEIAEVDLGLAMAKTKRTFERLEKEIRKEFGNQETGAKAVMAGILLNAKKDPNKSKKAEEYHDRLRAMLEGRGTKSTPWETTLNQWGGMGGEFYRTDSQFDRKEILNRELAKVKAGGMKYGDPDDMLSIRIKMIEQAKKMLIIDEDRKHALEQHRKGLINENQLNEKLGELRREQLKLEFEYNRSAAQRNLKIRAAQAEGRAKWADADFAAGKITGSEWAQIQRGSRQSKRAAFGLDPDKGGAPQASIGTIFREEWKYGPKQQADDFEAGMADVAVTVKDSMKEAIKNIASGADSFKDAMFNVFAAVADKLADQGISMGVDSMFNWLSKVGQNKDGGYIPRGYNQGGVVTGGSGVRDDVMTRMQGGEYVIKKSAAQKIGYETLGAINSYAGGGQARVSLAKEFLYNDPKRPTGGNYNVSRNLSTAALFREDDPQTSEMFGRQSTLTSYLEYRRKEQERRDKILDGIKQQKRQRLTSAYMSAAMRIGVAKFGDHLGGGETEGVDKPNVAPGSWTPPPPPDRSLPTDFYNGARGGSPAMVMGGEYIMSPRTVSKYGTGFMSQLNQGRLPSFQSGGPVGGGAAMAAGITTNNVSLSVNIDKSGGATAETGGGSKSEAKNDERGDAEEAQRNKEFAEAIRGAVLKEITKQQRPGGLLRDGATWAAGRRA